MPENLCSIRTRVRLAWPVRVLPAIAMFLIAGVCCMPCPANEQAEQLEPAYVVNDGTATVYAHPTHVTFWFHKKVAADDLKTAVAESEKIGPDLRENLAKRELRPSLVQASDPSLVPGEEHTVRISIELRFPAAGFAGGALGAGKLGDLCDQVKATAKVLGCDVTGPEFITTDKATVIQNAVKEAAKNAYIAASGAAAALNANIRAVTRVKVGKITWNTPPDSPIAYPTIEDIACTAEVRVTYLLDSP